jgi:ribosomal protein L37AE/L43A
MQPSNSDKTRRHRLATSVAMKKDAAQRQCPKCGRKSALKRMDDGDLFIVSCRWCDYERGGYIIDLVDGLG